MTSATPGIRYADGNVFTIPEMMDLFRRVHPGRVVDDTPEEVGRMFAPHANLVATAWAGSLLIGFARGFTDFHIVAYLADLAVDHEWRKRGVGRGLVEHLMARLEPGAKMVLLSSPEADGFYQRLGFTSNPRGWIFQQSGHRTINSVPRGGVS